MKPFELINASSLASALSELSKSKTALAKAGGVDLLDLMKEGIVAPPRLVNLRTIAGGADKLDAISAANGDAGAALGPLVTLAQLGEHKAIAGVDAYRALAQAAAAAATPQIRNMASLGGNLCQRPRCWYFRNADYPCLRKGGDKCFAHSGDNTFHAIFDNDKCAIVHPSAAAVALVALDGKLVLSRAGGKTREVAAGDFFVSPAKDVHHENVLQPGELISAIKLPAPQAGQRSAYLKQKHKQSFDWPLGEAAVSLTVADGKITAARVVLGSVAPRPWRAAQAEAALVGNAAGGAGFAAVARAAADAALAGASPLDDNDYKVALVKTLVQRALVEASQGGR